MLHSSTQVLRAKEAVQKAGSPGRKCTAIDESTPYYSSTSDSLEKTIKKLYVNV
jgi:hypothetical protein